MPQFPSMEWFAVPANWQDFSGSLNMKFTMRLADRLAADAEPGQAVNTEITAMADELEADGVPREIREAFVTQYRESRATLLAGAAVWAKHLKPTE